MYTRFVMSLFVLFLVIAINLKIPKISPEKISPLENTVFLEIVLFVLLLTAHLLRVLINILDA